MKLQWTIIGILFIVISIISCKKILPGPPSDDELLDGPVAGLNAEQSQQHLRGDMEFNDHIFTTQNGLGPVFVAASCGSCHIGDGKGHPFTTLTRFGQSDTSGNTFLHLGGPLLQTRAIPGYQPEKLPPGAPTAKLTPPIVSGGGFLELVPESDLLAMEDPNDADADGISGRVNRIQLPWYITPPPGSSVVNGKYISRFGKKGATYNLFQQTVTAYNQDMGICTSFNPKDPYSLQDIDPEIPNTVVYDVLFYLQTLKAPVQRNTSDPDVIAGKQIFIQTGCASCHKTTLKTGNSNIESLSNKEFHPYTDLLLHNMGTELDDGYTEGNALSYEWKTAPLWGLGLAPDSQGGRYYLLHDGRASTIEKAIGFHGGEAASRRENSYQLSQSDKEKLIKFLKSL